MIIDTHLHLIDRGKLSYPWLADVPALDGDWTFADYNQLAQRAGIEAVLHMEVDVAEEDIDKESEMIADLMTQYPILKGAISAARPESGSFEAWLEQVDINTVKGVRRILHVMPDETSQTETFRRNIAKLGDKGLPFDICMAQSQLALAAELIDAAPNTQYILDHCGVPEVKDGTFDDWAQKMAELSKREQLVVKMSGIPTYGPPDWTQETLQPYIDKMIELFGFDRMVWGSDSPVCTLQSSLPEWIATSHALLEGANADEKQKLFALNAKRVWKI